MDSTFHLLNIWGKVHVDTFVRRVVNTSPNGAGLRENQWL